MNRLHPDCAGFLDAVASLDLPAGLRTRYGLLCDRFAAVPPPSVTLYDEPPLRWYAPPAATAALLWLHGGRFISGGLDTHDSLCRLLASATGRAVIAVDYRLAPEHPFPAALDDSIAALHTACTRYDRVAVGGDSAGACLALTAALSSVVPLDALILVYPMIDATCHLSSHAEFENGPGPSSLDMRAGWDAWILPGADRSDPRVSPLFAGGLTSLPRTLLVTAGFDPLRDEGLLLASRLVESGVPLAHTHLPDHIHGFLTYPAAFAKAAEITQSCAKFLGSPALR